MLLNHNKIQGRVLVFILIFFDSQAQNQNKIPDSSSQSNYHVAALVKPEKHWIICRGEVKKDGFAGVHIPWNHDGGSILFKKAGERFSNKTKEMGFNNEALYKMCGREEDIPVCIEGNIHLTNE